MDINEGMYIRTRWGKIGKVVEISDIIDVTDIKNPEKELAYIVDTNYWYEDEPDSYLKTNIKKADNNIGRLLEPGDYLDNHCIEKIEGTTIYLADGWFIDFEDVEDMVDVIITKEQWENSIYRLKGDENE